MDHRSPATSIGRRAVLWGAAAGVAATAISQPAFGAPETQHADGGGNPHRVPPEQISIQLYTLRNQLAIDLPGTLAALRQIGYRRVEHAGFVGRTAAQFRAALDAAGLRATSGHVGIPQPFNAATWQAALADANIVGNTYIVHPFFGIDANGQPIRSAARYHALARDLNRAGALARQAGLRFGYHNHQLEFFRMTEDEPNRTGFDILADETDPRLVHFEMDIFWTYRGAHDPVDVIRDNRGRIKQVHVKDMNAAGSFEDPGQGLIDFGRVFAHAREAGLVEYIVERDDAGSAPRTPAQALDTARIGYQYLRNLRF